MDGGGDGGIKREVLGCAQKELEGGDGDGDGVVKKKKLNWMDLQEKN